jgi:PTS system nitrogen regulatory IIA component
MKITEFLSLQAVLPRLSGRNKPDVLRELSEALATAYPPLNAGRVLEVLVEREKLNTTGIGEGVAIPHGKLAGLPRLYGAFGVSQPGVDFASIDGKRTQLFFALVAPENSAGIHLKALARISRLFRNADFRDAILKAPDAERVYALISEEDARA